MENAVKKALEALENGLDLLPIGIVQFHRLYGRLIRFEVLANRPAGIDFRIDIIPDPVIVKPANEELDN